MHGHFVLGFVLFAIVMTALTYYRKKKKFEKRREYYMEEAVKKMDEQTANMKANTEKVNLLINKLQDDGKEKEDENEGESQKT